MLTIGSLFSGIGGIELGLEWAGLGPVIWQAESDPYCLKVLEKHWPEAKRFSDVRNIDGRINRPDLICAGFPCQPFSVAGKRKGAEDERNLWPETARIIRLLRPRFVMLENVPALLTYEYIGQIFGDLAACGYDFWWDCIPAAALGAPHRRDRLYMVARRISDSHGNALRNEPERRKDRAQATDSRNAVIADDGAIGEMADTEKSRCRSGRTRRLVINGEGIQKQTPSMADSHGSRFQERWRDIAIPAEYDPAKCSREIVAHSAGPRCKNRLQTPGSESATLAGESKRSGWWATEPELGRVADGVPHRVDRLRSLGNAVVPQVAQFIGSLIVDSIRAD